MLVLKQSRLDTQKDAPSAIHETTAVAQEVVAGAFEIVGVNWLEFKSWS